MLFSPATKLTEGFVAHYFNVLSDCVFTITHDLRELRGVRFGRPDFDLGLITLRLSVGSTVQLAHGVVC